MNFPSHIFFNDINHGYKAAILKKNSLWLLPFYMVVVTYFYYEKVRRTMRTAIVSYLFKALSSHPHWNSFTCCVMTKLKKLESDKNICSFLSHKSLSVPSQVQNSILFSFPSNLDSTSFELGKKSIFLPFQDNHSIAFVH